LEILKRYKSISQGFLAFWKVLRGTEFLFKFPHHRVLENDFSPWKSWKLHLVVLWYTGKAFRKLFAVPFDCLVMCKCHVVIVVINYWIRQCNLASLALSVMHAHCEYNAFLWANCMHLYLHWQLFLCFGVILFTLKLCISALRRCSEKMVWGSWKVVEKLSYFETMMEWELWFFWWLRDVVVYWQVLSAMYILGTDVGEPLVVSSM